MATNWQVGDRIQNRWEVHKILKGGMGLVYVVYDHELREPFAAKTFQDDIFGRSTELAVRFTQEAHTWINLDTHQNVTEAKFVRTLGGKPYLFLEFVSGGDLSNWIGTPRLIEDLPQVLRFAIQFCDGMKHSLAKGITAHRDIKPQNCLITEDRTLKVTDFGLAKVLDYCIPSVEDLKDAQGRNTALTRTGIAAGTCTHMAPEQFDDAKHVDMRADVYSFGILLYQMLMGRLPFLGRTWEEFEHLHKSQRIPVLTGHSLEVTTIVQSCLAKDPSDRYASFDELRVSLANIYQAITGDVARQPVTGTALGAVKCANKAISLGELGRTGEALDHFDRAIAIDSSIAEVWTSKGLTLRTVGRLDEALACHDSALELNPTLPNAWCNKGTVFLLMGMNEKALDCSNRAIDLNPMYVEAWSNKGIALARLKRNEEALGCYDRALKIDPSYEKAWSSKATALARLNRQDEAINCFDRALAINDRFADSWWGKGAVLSMLGRTEEAIASCTRALEIDPKNVLAWLTKGTALRNIGEHDEAVTCYDPALELDSLQESIWSCKAEALAELGQFQEAIGCCERALNLNSRNADAWYIKGSALLKGSQLIEEAFVCFEEAKRLGHSEAAALIALYQKIEEAQQWTQKGKSFSNLGKYEEAVACYDRALKFNSDDDLTWHSKGFALRALGRYEEAITCYETALALNPHDGKTWSSKAVALGALGRHEEELSCCDRALELNPNHSVAWSNRGTALLSLRRSEQALVCFNRALELDPSNGQAWMNSGAVLVNCFQDFGKAQKCFEEARQLGHSEAEQAINICMQMTSRQSSASE